MKCWAIKRKDDPEQFNADEIKKIVGSPWEPVPGRNMRIPTNIEESGEILDDEGEREGHTEEGIESEERFKASFDPNEDQEEPN